MAAGLAGPSRAGWEDARHAINCRDLIVQRQDLDGEFVVEVNCSSNDFHQIQNDPGKITRDNGDGTYDVEYDDGHEERQVKAEHIDTNELRVGDTVKWQKYGGNYDATITPRYLADRGEMLEAEFRYLSEHTEGDVGLGYMPDDQQYGDRRSLVVVQGELEVGDVGDQGASGATRPSLDKQAICISQLRGNCPHPPALYHTKPSEAKPSQAKGIMFSYIDISR